MNNKNSIFKALNRKYSQWVKYLPFELEAYKKFDNNEDAGENNIKIEEFKCNIKSIILNN